MNVRAQISMVFHLDKCIGCHTCSIACKNIWTPRRGAEYMWWNNVETKPGTGYPTLWEDQEVYHGGWARGAGGPRLRLQGRARALANLFHNPRLPALDDYYEPWTYNYRELLHAPPQADQPVALPVSQVSGRRMRLEAGPNWDDDLGGSDVYAANDPNLKGWSEEERRRLFELENLILFYLPRICNHCLNPGCVAACPAGAIYKRGEDGIVLVSQDKCRAWRMCVSGCPYKKVYYNWDTGKSEKCILCYPRQETGQAPACFHACVGRIRYLGVLLYDADRIRSAANVPDRELAAAQRELILDPFDPQVARKAREDGVAEGVLAAARASPVYRFVKRWKLALPIHPEFRTIPMLFYVPPLLPVPAGLEDGLYEVWEGTAGSADRPRVPDRYLAALLSAGDEEQVAAARRKVRAVRLYRQAQVEGSGAVPVGAAGAVAPGGADLGRVLEEGGTNPQEAEEIARLTCLPGYGELFVPPPFRRETAIEVGEDPAARQAEAGIGFLRRARRKGR